MLVSLSSCAQFKMASRDSPVEEVSPEERRYERKRLRPDSEERRHWARQKDNNTRRTDRLADNDRREGPSEATGERRDARADKDLKPVPPRDKRVKSVIKEAKKYLGTPYAWGGMSQKGVDCSGLMVVAFKAADVSIPRVSGDQYKHGKSLKRKDLAPGDMVFFTSPGNGGVAHSGLVIEVIGKGDKVKFIHASSSKGVIISDLDGYYWRDHFRWACRVF